MTIDRFGEYAYCELPSLYDHSVADPFAALLKDPNAQLVHLVELYPYDEDLPLSLNSDAPFGTLSFGEFNMGYTGGVNPQYLSDLGFITEPTDTPSSVYFIAQVDNPLQIDVSVLSGDDFAANSPSYGAIRIQNGNGKLDHLAGYHWNGRRVVVKAGAVGFKYDEFAIVFDGIASGIEADDDTVTINIKDNRAKTDLLLAPSLYLGTGGLEGGEDIEGKPKPLCFGEAYNIEPILIDPVNLIYQVNDGSIESVLNVRDSGIALTNGGNYSNILTAPVSAGNFVTQLSGGYIKLGSTPAGRVTADIEGDNIDGYSNTINEIVTKIVTKRLGASALQETEIDQGSMNALSSIGTVGYYITEPTTASEVIDDLITSTGCYWTFSRQGQLLAGVLEEPNNPTYEVTETNVDESGISLPSVIAPAWRISVAYSPVWTVQQADELGGGTTDADRTFLSEEYRYVVSENRSVRTKNSQSIEKIFYTKLANRADAEALLARLERVYSEKRKLYRVPIWKGLYRVYIRDQVTLKFPRFGLSQGKTLLITGVSEDAESASTILELWG